MLRIQILGNLKYLIRGIRGTSWTENHSNLDEFANYKGNFNETEGSYQRHFLDKPINLVFGSLQIKRKYPKGN